MSPPVQILLLLAVSIVGVTTITILLFRFVVRRTGIEHLLEDGIVLDDSGIQFLGFLFVRKTAGYDKIEAVEFVPFPKNLLSGILYGPSVSSNAGGGWFNPFRGTVVVTFTDDHWIRHRLFSPGNPRALAEELRARIKHTTGRPPNGNPM